MAANIIDYRPAIDGRTGQPVLKAVKFLKQNPALLFALAIAIALEMVAAVSTDTLGSWRRRSCLSLSRVYSCTSFGRFISGPTLVCRLSDRNPAPGRSMLSAVFPAS